MLAKSNRITVKNFKEMYSRRPDKVASSGSLLLHFFSDKNIDKPQFAVSASKKKLKKAHMRNLLRRRVYGAIREKGVRGFKNGRYIVHLRSQVSNAPSFGDISADIDRLFVGYFEV